jgi:hypothetical protein
MKVLKPLTWLKKKKCPSSHKAILSRGETLREVEAVDFNVTQFANAFKVEGDGVCLDFAVEGIEVPPGADASFAVWALLPRAMEGGFNHQLCQPIDPLVATNAERLSRIWEMWVPKRYQSIRVSGGGHWSKIRTGRSPRVDLYSGGVDSTFSVLQLAQPNNRGYALTVEGLDYRDHRAERFPKLIAKTNPLLERLNYQRIVIRTNANYDPISLTHCFTLASCLFLLSDLFEEGTIAADRTPAQDMVTFPWGTNCVTKCYFAGSDFAMRTVSEISRVEKLASIAASDVALPFLSFCRRHKVMPSNCGRCGKCVRTKAMFAAATGRIPEIFIDNAFNENLLKRIELDGRERAHVLDLYCYAKDHGRIDAVPGLLSLVEQCREFDPHHQAD